jgi:acetyl-CoA acyltransferase
MTDPVIAGVGMTPFGKYPNTSLGDLASRAVEFALLDARMATSDVGIVFFANASAGVVTGQEMIRGQISLQHTGLLGTPIVNVENACASSSSAVHLARLAVLSGAYEVALVVGAERLTHPTDNQRPFAALATGADVSRREEFEGALGGGGGSFFMDVYADIARRYMAASGATERDFAQVAVKNHRHGSLNPNAQYRNLVTVEEVLASRVISEPLTLLMCSPIGDGAAAVVVCSLAAARRHGADAVRIRASALVTGVVDEKSDPSPAERAAQRAYEQAGIQPADVDVVEVHDASAPAELVIYEELGLCESGAGPAHLASGATSLGGRQPVNVSGGLLSKGHPVGATGCAQIVELVEQVRGRCGDRQVDGARIALAENAGGFLNPDAAAAVVTILSKD